MTQTITSPGTGAERKWQGIPSIAEWKGRLWITWYTGGDREPSRDNHIVLESSDDDGLTWTPELTIDGGDSSRAFDPNLWVDPAGRLWHFWNETDEATAELFDGVGGVWARVAASPGSWSDPLRIADGVAMNKPVVAADGSWLLCASVWGQGPLTAAQPRATNVIASDDDGVSWTLRGSTTVAHAERTFDEHMLVQLPSGILWMLIRTLRGLAESFSTDGGHTWTLVRPSGFNPHPSSRVWFSALGSGTLVLVSNAAPMTRDGIAVRVSTDDGLTWAFPTVIDSRYGVSYPDAFEGADGRLHIVYDRDRGGAGDIILASVTVDAASGAVTVVREPTTVNSLR